jgi:hypothetical protein
MLSFGMLWLRSINEYILDRPICKSGHYEHCQNVARLIFEHEETL